MSEWSEDEAWARDVIAALPPCPTCTRCGATPMSSNYRWNGEAWEHRCPDIDAQAGHLPIEDALPEGSDR